jgi:hypothetical protein
MDKPHFDAYAQHGAAGEPMRTERLDVRRNEVPQTHYARRGPIASHWEAKLDGRWRRIMISSGSPSHFIKTKERAVGVLIVPHKEAA